MVDAWNYTDHILCRHTGSMTLTWALKENMGDPEGVNLLSNQQRALRNREVSRKV